MKKAGCPDNKWITNKKIIDSVNLCKKHKIKTVCSYIFGHPTETEKELYETINFSLSTKSYLNIYNKMMPIPGS